MNVINYRELLSVDLKEYSECNQLQRVTNVGLKEYSECNQLQRVTKRGFEGVQ